MGVTDSIGVASVLAFGMEGVNVIFVGKEPPKRRYKWKTEEEASADAIHPRRLQFHEDLHLRCHGNTLPD